MRRGGRVGALIVGRRGNAVGWALIAIGAGFVVTIFASNYATLGVLRGGLHDGRRRDPGAGVPAGP